MQSVTIRIGNIKVTGEVRGSDAEMKTLMDSMAKLDQLQDVVLNSRHELIAGRRRVEAARRLKWTHVRAVINPSLDDALKALKAERDENCPGCRVNLTRKEQLELARKLEALENPEAAARKAAAQAKKGVGKAGAGKFPAPDQKGDTRDKVGAAVGMSGRTLEKAQQVIEAGQTESERYFDLAERMGEEDEPVDPLYEEFKKRKQIFTAADNDPRFADIANMLKENRDTTAAFNAFEKRRDELSQDQAGTPIPKRLMKVFNDSWLTDAATVLEYFVSNSLKNITAAVKKHECPHLDSVTVLSHLEAVHNGLTAAHSLLWDAQPYAVCPKCEGAGCRLCKKSGWLPKPLYLDHKKWP